MRKTRSNQGLYIPDLSTEYQDLPGLTTLAVLQRDVPTPTTPTVSAGFPIQIGSSTAANSGAASSRAEDLEDDQIDDQQRHVYAQKQMFFEILQHRHDHNR